MTERRSCRGSERARRYSIATLLVGVASLLASSCAEREVIMAGALEGEPKPKSSGSTNGATMASNSGSDTANGDDNSTGSTPNSSQPGLDGSAPTNIVGGDGSTIMPPAILDPPPGNGDTLKCSVPLPGVLLEYGLNGVGDDEIWDSDREHDGTLWGKQFMKIKGPPGCDNAIYFTPDNEESFIEVPDSPDWQLEKGSIDFWVKTPNSIPETRTLISRDARGEEKPGHLHILLMNWMAISIRMQHKTNSMEINTPVPKGRWFHFGFNFGPPALEVYVDGALYHRLEANSEWSIAGNQNPWTIGANTADSDEGVATPIRKKSFLHDVGLDHVRISSQRHDFSKPN